MSLNETWGLVALYLSTGFLWVAELPRWESLPLRTLILPYGCSGSLFFTCMQVRRPRPKD